MIDSKRCRVPHVRAGALARALLVALALGLLASLSGCGDNLECLGDECAPPGVELCNAPGDEDGDGDADCDDSDCTGDPACAPPCGNGIQNIGEECDDANTVDTDACTNTCNRARCGAGISQAGVEQCDDANTVNTDACTNTCQTARCGDAIVGPGEQCDDGNMVNTDACSNTCQTARCGDGAVGPGEMCDDGNMVDGDACTNACTTARCGDMVVRTGLEQCDDGNMVNTDACTNTCALPTCGDGFMQAGEQCDDMNMVNTDGCLNTCMTARCGDGVTRAGVEECDDMNLVDTDACRNTCVTAECGDGVIQVGVDECDDGNLVDTDLCTNACTIAECGDGIVGPGEACDDGNMNNNDACTNTCQPAGCGNGFITGAETCDDGDLVSGDGCSDMCATEAGYVCNGMPSTCTTVCGDGVIAGFEGCDDGGVMNGNGCSAVCQVEPGFACGGQPSMCANTCGNGAVDANEQCDDGNLLAADGCSSICRFDIGCPVGETQVSATNTTPVATIDNMTVTSTVMFTGNESVSRMVVYLGSLTHTFDADLDISLSGPRMITRDLSSDNGGAGDNYLRTFFDDSATTPIQLGTAPFSGRFKPEQVLSGGGGFRGQIIGGVWTLNVGDDANGDGGTLSSWTLIACTSLQVPRCGNGNIDIGEECDDGNLVANDMCTNACGRVDGCGDGNIDMGEQCDDDNLVANDGCSAQCQAEAVCPAGQIAVAAPNNMMTAIPDNDTVVGVSSTALVAPVGGVASVRVLLRGITHTNDADLDIELVAPNGVRRRLSDDNGGTGDNYLNTTLDDLAIFPITDTTNAMPPFSGSFRPEESLSTTVGTDFRRSRAQGTWTLRVFDDTATNTGTLDAWTLFVCVDPAPFCGDGLRNGAEECDDGNLIANDTCDNFCNVADGCGDGNIDMGEQCDDNNLASGDGCSAACQVDISCPAGQVVVNVSNNMASPIPDNDQVVGVASVVTVAQMGGITSARVLINNITHTAAGDLDMFLIGPTGLQRELSTDNGALADNFVNTVFSDGAAAVIPTTGAPYNGAFRPEQSLTTTFGTDFSRQRSSGNWTLRIFDDATGDTGTLTGWTLLACVDPLSACGDSMVNGGVEECDDGNSNNADLCSNFCQIVDGCGDGNIDMGEVCDDNNVVSGDGCSAACALDIACAAGQTPVVVSNAMATPIPDNLIGGVLSTITVPTAGLIRRAIVTVNVNHAVTAHVDMYLLSPRGGQRALVQDKTGVNYVATSFSDAAATTIGSAATPATGTFRPEQSLDIYNNQSAAGDWLLRIADDTAATTGTLTSWSVALCVDPVAPTLCGNGIVEGLETCDDGNLVANDGCSNLCQVELGCAVGQVPLIFTSTDAKAVIPDNNATGITHIIPVAGAGNVQRAVAVVNAVGHTFDGDLNLTLVAPNAMTVDLSSGNGGGGDDFLSTMLADAATTNVTAGTAPFRGRFKPEGSLPTLNGQPAAGMWGLRVVDTANGDAGALRTWTIGLCTAP